MHLRAARISADEDNVTVYIAVRKDGVRSVYTSPPSSIGHFMPSIRQVAKLAGVSTATVSRALQQPDVVAASTRERVLAAVAKVGYTPNFLATNLRKLRSHAVLALVPDIGNAFFSEIIKGMEQVASERGYSVLLGNTHNDPEREFELAARVAARQADGLVTLSARIPFRNYRESLRQGTLPPIVNACECVSGAGVPIVQIDNRAAAAKATAHLIDLGHRRIGFVKGPDGSPLTTDRLNGYERALRTASIPLRTEYIFDGDFSAESGLAAAEGLLGLAQPPTAIFCSNDEMAIGAIRMLRSRGVSVPAQMSVMGFDDIPLARYIDPPLSTVLQPKLEMGREAMKILCDLLEGRAPAKLAHTLPFQLIVRDSTARRRSTR